MKISLWMLRISMNVYGLYLCIQNYLNKKQNKKRDEQHFLWYIFYQFFHCLKCYLENLSSVAPLCSYGGWKQVPSRRSVKRLFVIVKWSGFQIILFESFWSKKQVTRTLNKPRQSCSSSSRYLLKYFQMKTCG